MERESFEDEEIGKILSDHFVCVKVDREERPDVDKVYMTFVQVCVCAHHFGVYSCPSICISCGYSHDHRQRAAAEVGP